MIIGIGCDIVEIKRITQVPDPEKFARRILNSAEFKVYTTLSDSNKSTFLAGRFAAKEAFAKAMGCGIGATLSWQDITVLNHESGAPYLSCPTLPKHQNCHLSIAHELHYAVAYCIISKV